MRHLRCVINFDYHLTGEERRFGVNFIDPVKLFTCKPPAKDWFN